MTIKKPKKIVILYSGGADSYILKKYAEVTEPGTIILPIYYEYFNPTTKLESKEIPEWVSKRNIDWYNLPNMEMLEKESDPGQKIYIPGRNLVFAILAACQELPDEIWMGTVLEEDHPDATDKNQEFVNLTEKVLNYVNSPWKTNVKIRFPFVEDKFTKFMSVKWALDNGITGREIRKTISCYDPHFSPELDQILACGTCKQCTRRALIHMAVGIFDIGDYKKNPLNCGELYFWLGNLMDRWDDYSESQLNEFPPYFLMLSKYLKDNPEIQVQMHRGIYIDLIENRLRKRWEKSPIFQKELALIDDVIGDNGHLENLITKEDNYLIKQQLIEINKAEKYKGERIGDTSPRTLRILFGDGYKFFAKRIETPNDEGLIKDGLVVDICCGEGKHLKELGADLGIDLLESPNDQILNIDLIREFNENSLMGRKVDTFTWLQAIEHFSRFDARRIIFNLLQIGPRRIMISTINKNCNPFVDGTFILTGEYNEFHKYEYGVAEFRELGQFLRKPELPFKINYYSQYFWNGQSYFIDGLHETAVNFYLVAEYS